MTWEPHICACHGPGSCQISACSTYVLRMTVVTCSFHRMTTEWYQRALGVPGDGEGRCGARSCSEAAKEARTHTRFRRILGGATGLQDGDGRSEPETSMLLCFNDVMHIVLTFWRRAGRYRATLSPYLLVFNDTNTTGDHFRLEHWDARTCRIALGTEYQAAGCQPKFAFDSFWLLVVSITIPRKCIRGCLVKKFKLPIGTRSTKALRVESSRSP